MQRFAIVYKYYTKETMFDKGHEKAKYGITFVKEFNYGKVMKLAVRKTNLHGRLIAVYKLDKDDPNRTVIQVHGKIEHDPAAASMARNAFKDILPRPQSNVLIHPAVEKLLAHTTGVAARINAKPTTKAWRPPYHIEKTQPRISEAV